jgi:hypothetical protein
VDGKLTSSKSSDSAVASVKSKSGLVTAKKAGKCTIKVKTGKKTLTCKVTVKKSVELSKYFGSYASFKKAVGYMRQATVSEEPVTYTGTLYFGSGANTSNGYFFIRTDTPGGKVVMLQNLKKKQFTLYGVRLGDSASRADKILLKKGFKWKKTYTYSNGTQRVYKKGSNEVRIFITFKNIVSSYQWSTTA